MQININRFSQCVLHPITNTSPLDALTFAYFFPWTLVILSYHFSPSILCRHQLKNICSLLASVLVILKLSDPKNCSYWTLDLNIVSLVQDLISFDFHKFFLALWKPLSLVYSYFNIFVPPNFFCCCLMHIGFHLFKWGFTKENQVLIYSSLTLGCHCCTTRTRIQTGKDYRAPLGGVINTGLINTGSIFWLTFRISAAKGLFIINKSDSGKFISVPCWLLVVLVS